MKIMFLTTYCSKFCTALNNVYTATRYGDLHEDWETFLELALVKTRDPRKRKKCITINICIMMFHVFNSYRIAAPSFWQSDYNYVFGHTVSNIGNVAGLTAAAAGTALFQCALYRMLLLRRLLKDDKTFSRTTRKLSLAATSQEQVVGFRRQSMDENDGRLKMNRILIACAVVGFPACCLITVPIVCGMLAFNIMASVTTTQIYWWTFWCVIDNLLVTIFSLDVVIFPCMWLVVTLNYRLDIDKLATKVKLLAGKSRDRSQMAYQFQSMVRAYKRMMKKSVAVNRISAPILFVISSCTNPIACICMFVFMYSDNIIIWTLVPATGVVLAIAASAILFLAANVTRKSDEVHETVMSTTGNRRLGRLLSPQEKQYMLEMGEHLDTESHSLALVTTTGERYTSEALVLYLIETALHYTLLITYENSMNINSD